MNDVSTNPNWNKLRLHWVNFLKNPALSWLFAKNQFYALQDFGLHIDGTQLRSKSEQTAKATCTLASLTPEIFDYLKADKPLFLK